MLSTISNPIPLSSLPAFLWQCQATIQCGFPSPAENHAQERLDLNSLLIHQPDATFFMRVRGTSMINAGINDGDYVVVDRSLNAKNGSIVVAIVDGEFTIKTLSISQGLIQLSAENPAFPTIRFNPDQELVIWGVVTWTLKNHRLSV